MKVTEYIIVTNEQRLGLINDVEMMIEEGYQPLSGAFKDQSLWCQTMVKYEHPAALRQMTATEMQQEQDRMMQQMLHPNARMQTIDPEAYRQHVLDRATKRIPAAVDPGPNWYDDK